MTEAEWLAATEPAQMFRQIWDGCTERKRRLYECACCRRVWHELPDPRSRRAVEVAELLADGLVGEDEIRAAEREAYEVWEADRPIAFDPTRDGEERDRDFWPRPYSAAAFNVTGDFGDWGAVPLTDPPSRIILELVSDRATESAARANLLRDIFGNPFRPVAFDPRWRSETAVALATGIYAGRAFDRLPILADSLEEAGCDHTDVLAHCRGPGPHVRGCWVVDAVLGKE